jgi:hypothetical protein
MVRQLFVFELGSRRVPEFIHPVDISPYLATLAALVISHRRPQAL